MMEIRQVFGDVNGTWCDMKTGQAGVSIIVDQVDIRSLFIPESDQVTSEMLDGWDSKPFGADLTLVTFPGVETHVFTSQFLNHVFKFVDIDWGIISINGTGSNGRGGGRGGVLLQNRARGVMRV